MVYFDELVLGMKLAYDLYGVRPFPAHIDPESHFPPSIIQRPPEPELLTANWSDAILLRCIPKGSDPLAKPLGELRRIVRGQEEEEEEEEEEERPRQRKRKKVDMGWRLLGGSGHCPQGPTPLTCSRRSSRLSHAARCPGNQIRSRVRRCLGGRTIQQGVRMMSRTLRCMTRTPDPGSSPSREQMGPGPPMERAAGHGPALVPRCIQAHTSG